MHMHYYNHDIGHYTSHTAQLRPLADLAYRRMLDWYYLHEKPLPLPIEVVAEEIRLDEPEFHPYVEKVLTRFFLRTDEGWRHKRCDEEIAKARGAMDRADQADQHEQTRQQRHRERRTAMFEALRKVDVIPPFNTKTGVLEGLLEANGIDPATLEMSQATEGRDGTGDGTGDTCDALVTSPATASRARTQPQPQPQPHRTINTPLPPKGGKRGEKRAPADFSVTEDMRAWAAVKVPGMDITAETEKFMDWEFKAARTDWPATWRTWMRRAYESRGGGQQSSLGGDFV